MSGQVNRYTLNVIVDDNETIPIAKGYLQMIDEVTSKYRNKEELLNAICNIFNMKIVGQSVRINITYNQNKQTRSLRVLYHNSKGALEMESVKKKVLLYSGNKNFAILFAGRYCNSHYMSNLASEVIEAVQRNEKYSDPLNRIIDLAFASYKSVRDIYFFLDDYEKKEKACCHDVTDFKTGNRQDLVCALKELKIICNYQQLNFFDLLDDNQTNRKDVNKDENSKIKKKKA